MKNESKTLFIPLYGKAQMSREGLFRDEYAERITESVLPEDYERVDTSKRLAIYMAMRAEQFDRLTEGFISKHPDGIVIHAGCGLDSRAFRVNGRGKQWYDLDFPDVIELRRKYYEESDDYKMLGYSVTDEGWFEEINYNGEPVLVLAEGLSMYLTRQEIERLMVRFSERFSRTVFIMDAYSTFAAKMSRLKNPINAMGAKVYFAMDKGEELTENVPQAECFLTADIISKAQVNRLKGIYKARFTFMKKAGGGLYRIYGYKIKTLKG